MYEIAAQVQAWLADGRPVQVAQVVATKGFSSRDPGAALAWSDSDWAGGLLPVIDAKLVGTGTAGLVEVPVSDTEAVAEGLSCGGVASVLVQAAAAYGTDTWQRLARREPLCLLTEITQARGARTEVFGPANVRDATNSPGAGDVPRLFARGVTSAQLLPTEGGALAVVTLWPPTTLVVVGDGSIATALADAGGLLGWSVSITSTADDELLGGLTESDAVVVLSHDRDVDGPALAVALSTRCGYVGALGSRHTQAARRDWLDGHGVDATTQARIHGPAGLDIDAHTPAEIAVSITAEILATRSGSTGGSLRERPGPVHTGGVSAPPPRYEA